MKNDKLTELNQERKENHRKDPKEENFIEQLNNQLLEFEKNNYTDLKEEQHPTIFIFGAPRSGTTLMSQTVAHGFDIGFINNLSARFWKTPITGIKLSNSVLKNNKSTDFQSNFASTKKLQDIHEFGYFWRYWLKKDSITNIVNSQVLEKEINWGELKKIILNIHQAFGKGFACKNVLGAYHISSFLQLLKKLVFIYIERDPVDAAISILNARKKYYTNLNLWWSYVPLEFEKIKDLDYKKQIAGQVYYLTKYYNSKINEINSSRIIHIKYKDLCDNPKTILEKIMNVIKKEFNYDLNIIDDFPKKFEYRTYHNSELRKEFENLLKDFQKDDK
jgi:hypothetical protein